MKRKERLTILQKLAGRSSYVYYLAAVPVDVRLLRPESLRIKDAISSAASDLLNEGCKIIPRSARYDKDNKIVHCTVFDRYGQVYKCTVCPHTFILQPLDASSVGPMFIDRR